ncbi:MAG: bifunctional 5,10-methylenetetrahydrofolate dehydrogenase/5,10-methenyltetrahydrofolate cyclohydrolase [Candidatus Taylorbacteria bacterium]|nr:bifunctional 5,10-methylenetetrahydrofolate dehydrogenase/5,10-methenyltetrahydrofolate cyclohydrolase [Candidatus Taylorbacteria bacterium]
MNTEESTVCPLNSAVILDGRKLRDARTGALKKEFSAFLEKPVLVIIQVGDLAESDAYIRQKVKFGELLGVPVIHKKFPDSIDEKVLIEAIRTLNHDTAVKGVIVQLPIPSRFSTQKIIDEIDQVKDVDGLTLNNKKRFEGGDKQAVVPATARGVLTLLRGYHIPVSGRKVTVIGRSTLVGSPIATLLSREGASVTTCHRGTEKIPEKAKGADVLIVATGNPHLVTKEYVSPEQTVIDVGINSIEGQKLEEEIPSRKIVGDVDFEGVKDIVGAISPVPGGVGPMTVLSLFENLKDACRRS